MLLRINPKITNARGERCDTAATMSEKKSSVKMQIILIASALNLGVADMIKNKPSPCDAFDIMRKAICTLLKKTLPNKILV